MGASFDIQLSIIAIDDQQDATILIYLFIYSQSALRVSGDVFAHHHEHLSVFTASGIVHRCCCRLMFVTPAGSNISQQNQKL